MTAKTALIALVATAVVVDGQRVIVAAGERLPPLDSADHDALLTGKSARVEAHASEGHAVARPAAHAAEQVVEHAAEPAAKPARKPSTKT